VQWAHNNGSNLESVDAIMDDRVEDGIVEVFAAPAPRVSGPLPAMNEGRSKDEDEGKTEEEV